MHPTLAHLLQGNQRFVEGRMTYPRQTSQMRQRLTNGQRPQAVILGCADSRVPPELIFDQGLGDLFVVRSAGNMPDEYALASIEYALLALQTPLILVLGHTQCGAIYAALQNNAPTPALQALVDAIRPAIAKTSSPTVDAVAAVHARRVASHLLTQSPLIAQAHANGHVEIVAALYHLDSGHVELV